MRSRFALLVVGACLLAAGTASAQFSEDFDGYTSGSTIAGLGGWTTWTGNPSGDTLVVATHSASPPNSLDVSGTADVVHTFSGMTSGTWIARVRTYVPSTQLGDLYLILLNRYDGACAGTGDCDWSMQIRMSAAAGEVASEGGSSNPSAAPPLPLQTDRWAELLVEIDLDSNQYTVWYEGTLLDQLAWTVTGDLNISAIDLFSNGSTESYVDDVWISTTLPERTFADDFDAYANGWTIVGRGAWETWTGGISGDTQVVASHSQSPPFSLAVSGTADVVHRFTGVSSGTWYAKVQTFVPSTQLGDLYFIILNRYDGACASPGDCDWSVQIRMTAATGQVASEGGSSNPSAAPPLPLLTDQWAEIVVEVDLDGNQYTVWYEGTLLDQLPWTVTGDSTVAAMDLFSNGSSESYMDDVWLNTVVPVELVSFTVE